MKLKIFFSILVGLLCVFSVSCQENQYYILQMKKIDPNMLNFDDDLIISSEQALALANQNLKQFLQIGEVTIKIQNSIQKTNSSTTPENSNNSRQARSENSSKDTKEDSSQSQSTQIVESEAQSTIVTQDPGRDADMKDQMSYLLYRLNQLRQENGAGPVSLDEDLNELAQLHNDDMVRRNYFSHENPQGQFPADRARKLGLNPRVAENLAKTVSLKRAHQGLAASPGHFRNSVNKQFQRVGFGITYTGPYIYLTVILGSRNYAKEPLSRQEVIQFGQGVSNIILQKNPNLRVKGQDMLLSNTTTSWMRSNRNQNIFAYLQRFGNKGRFSIRSISFPYSQNLLMNIRNNRGFINRDPKYTSFGVGLLQKNGIMEIILVFN